MAGQVDESRAKKDYERAVKVLNSFQATGANFGPIAKSKMPKIDLLKNCLERIELSMEQIDNLSIIHVAGTKGKGSTCAYAESILRNHGNKTGIFSSPHLIEVRERIRLNGVPVDEEIFTSAFWHAFDKLNASRASSEGVMPGYFAFTLLMALHVFVEQKVDAVLLEVGVGGEYDATNFIARPVACGIASLHLEHTEQLGHTLEEIGWHKAGIAKAGVPLVTVPHRHSVMAVILSRAKKRQSPLTVAPPLKAEEEELELGIAGDRQAINAALALQLCRIWLRRKGHGDVSGAQGDVKCLSDINGVGDIPKKESRNLTREEKTGLRETRLPGRNQVVKRGGVTYYLDGAHTTDSMQQCVSWFKEAARKEEEEIGGNVCRTLVFRMKATKSASDHISYLQDVGFKRAAFCPHVISTSQRERFPDSMDVREDPKEAKKIAASQLKDWTQLQPSPAPCVPRCFPSTVSALWWAGLGRDTPLEQMAKADLSLDSQSGQQQGEAESSVGPAPDDVSHVQVLVTGSLVMVGGALTLLQPDLWGQ